MVTKNQDDRFLQAGVNLLELPARVENDLDLLAELVNIFKEECPRLLRLLADSVASQDMKNVEATSHALKGMLSGLSATRAAGIPSRLELLGRGGNSIGCRNVLNLLKCEVADLLLELDAFTTKTKQ